MLKVWRVPQVTAAGGALAIVAAVLAMAGCSGGNNEIGNSCRSDGGSNEVIDLVGDVLPLLEKAELALEATSISTREDGTMLRVGVSLDATDGELCAVATQLYELTGYPSVAAREQALPAYD